jgi:NAD(P)-dependent dehydrogenase (short-subunit alcohol dehydrogenase family)
MELDSGGMDTPMRLSGRRALVTGGSRSIGRGLALGLAREGADVVVNFRTDRAAAERTATDVRALGRRAAVVQGDTSVSADVRRFVAAAVEALGSVDLLVNNAGILRRTPFLEIADAEWDAILDTNLKGYFLVGQAVARHMIERRTAGAIVNVSSAGQLVAAPNLTHYCVAKAGVEMLTKQMALELAPHRIRVNAVCPGLIETDLNRKDIADPAFRERRLARIPLKEIGTPDDVAGAVVFLASSDEARLVTGASVFIDGGQTIWGA